MEIDQNQVKNPLDQIPEENNTINQLQEWITLNRDFPAGIFYAAFAAEGIYVNPKMLEYLKLEQTPISLVLDEYFWSRLASISENPEQAHLTIVNAKERIQSEPNVEFKLDTGFDNCLVFRLFQINLTASGDRAFGGIVLDRVDGRAAFLRQMKMLEEISVKARKANASAKGNIDALVDNLQVWSPDVLNEFLFDIRNQFSQVNQSLDLMLNLIRAFEDKPVFSDTVNVVEFLKEVFLEEKQAEFRLSEQQENNSHSPLSVIDPALTRLALQYLIKEIISNNPEGQPVDVSAVVGEHDLIIRLENPRTLPLPGLATDQEEIEISDQNTRLFLAKKIINIQGGVLTILRKAPGSESISSIEISLPTTAGSQPFQDHDLLSAPAGKAEGRILLAEAQPDYQIRLSEILKGAGYRVDLTSDGSTALDMAQSINPDLVIVARNLPGLDGLLVTQGIRRWSAIPIIMLSERTDPGDLLYAYQLGVDDYLNKPLSTQELLVRAQVCLRRSENSRHPITADLFQSNLIRIDYSTRQVWIRGKPVELTPIEYNLLVFMSRQGKQIMPYEQLLESVWEGPDKGTRQGLFVHVKRLREKIEKDPKNPQIINNKWGVGYVFNP